MSDNSIVSLQIHSYTFIASYTLQTLRITLEVNHNDQVIFQSPRFTNDYFPHELKVLFQNVSGFYEYLYKVVAKNMSDRISFRNGLLKIKVFIDDKMRELPIRMRKMQEQKENMADSHFLLTSVNSRIEEEKESRLSSKLNGREEYSGARLKLMMLRENNKIKKAITKVPEFSSSTPANSQEYPYTKPQTVHRYDKYKTEEASNSRKSHSEGRTLYNHYGRSLTLKKNSKQGFKESNVDMSNKDLRAIDVKDIIGYDCSRVVLLNLGYNNIGNEGLKLLTSVRWPALKTLYVCFNNILKIEWTPANICFLRTLSLSGNKIKEIPKNIIQLQFLQELFIYNNKIEVIPQELSLMEELKNLSIYGNKLEASRNKKALARLKARKVQIWE